jgi:serine/threonine protein phosphatase PrpC
LNNLINYFELLFQNKNKDSGNNINDLLSFLGSSSLGSQKKPSLNLDSMNSKKSTSSTIQNKNTPFASFSYHEDKNLKYRQSMEDTGVTLPNLTNDYKTSLFGIFDGHGGNDVVKYIKDRIPEIIKKYINDLCPIEKCFINSFNKIDEELKFYDSENTGSTATIVLIQDNKIYCANVGDSRAYIIYNNSIKQITVDHKCSIPEEAERIMNAGGKITKNRVQGQLVLTRSLGDLYVKKYGVTNLPDISVNKIDYNIRYVVIASDGIWDVVDEKTVLSMSKSRKNAEEFCKDLVKLAIEKETKDNVSCIVISFEN